MARPNLSLEHMALTLAALGTSAVISACAKAEPATTVHSEPTASAAASPPPPPEATATATAAAADELKKNEGQKEPSPTVGGPQGVASTSPGSSSSPVKARKTDKTTGQASCGAGTCTADMKKK